jgi:hypothetical protein
MLCIDQDHNLMASSLRGWVAFQTVGTFTQTRIVMHLSIVFFIVKGLIKNSRMSHPCYLPLINLVIFQSYQRS